MIVTIKSFLGQSRMNQKYKAVYFADFPAENAKQKSLTLAFGKKTHLLYDEIKSLSSVEIKELLGTENYLDLVKQADKIDLPLNTHCLRLLKQSLSTIKKTDSQYSLLRIDSHETLFDPLTVTFKGGAKDPFIRWYPFLEGYSPQFVEGIIKRYAPKAQTILDPFAGTGTTVFTASKLNLKSFYCEINPLLQLINQTKINVRSLNSFQRTELVEKLIDINKHINDISRFEPDYLLAATYRHIFGKSVFFENTVYQQILQIRSWIDDISLESPLASNVVTIAVLSSLIPASNMKRAGDLRFKTFKEKQSQKINFVVSVYEKINDIIQDIKNDIDGMKTLPSLVSADAGSIYKIPHLNIDTVITSPPYVNGTNYFRNTKIELWFLRCLREKEDLKRFRLSSLTSGINDVSKIKIPSEIQPQVAEVVERLEQSSYDQRIPKMIACYFNEITNIFRSILPHFTSKATIAIDIGDSCYSGVHVPVDQLLIACLEDIGFQLQDEVTLRKRKSRGGMLLKQSLLVFEYIKEKNETITNKKNLHSSWTTNWSSFKRYLPHQEPPFCKRNWGHSWHSLCSYPGKLKPAIAHYLVKTFVNKGGNVLDPFSGVGTIPFEAALQGRKAYGFEINPAAYFIAKAKIQRPEKEKCLDIINNLKIFLNKNSPNMFELKEAQTFGFNGKLFEYYDKETLREIILARRYFSICKPESSSAAFVFASLLHILHGNRPYALSRRSHPITPYKPSGPFEYRPLLHHLIQKVMRNLQDPLPLEFCCGKVFQQDATKWWPIEICELDAIITSPPFFDSTRFYLANWIRLWFSGWSSRDFNERPKGFIEEKQKKGFDVYISILRQAKERLKKNGVLVFHLGKSKKCDMATQLKRISKNWFSHSEIFNESVTHCESHGIRDKGTVTTHQYLVMI